MAIDFKPEVDFIPDETPFDPSQIKISPNDLAIMRRGPMGPMDTMGPVTTDLTEAIGRSLFPNMVGNPNPSAQKIIGDVVMSPVRAASLPFQFIPHQVTDQLENLAADVGNVPFIGLGLPGPFEPGKPILPKFDMPEKDVPYGLNAPGEIYNQLSEMTTPGNVALAKFLPKVGPALDYARAKPPSIELAKALEQSPLEIPNEPAIRAERDLGVPVPPNPFFNPGVRELASRALEEAQKRAVLIPGAEPALAALRREFIPPDIQAVEGAPKAEPLGGQVSFNSPAEARAVPSARQTSVEYVIDPNTGQLVEARPSVTGPDAPSYRRPSPAPTQREAELARMKANVEAGLEGPAISETSYPLDILKENQFPKEGNPQGTLSNLQRSRIQAGKTGVRSNVRNNPPVSYFDRASEAAGLDRPSTAPTIESIRAQREREANAIQPEATQPVRPVREQPVEVKNEVSAKENSGKVNAGGGQGNAAQAEIAKWSGLDAPGFDKAIKDSGIGLTSSAYRLAEKLTSADIPELEAAQKKAHAERKEASKNAKTPKAFEQSMALGMKGQMFNEAIKWRKAIDEAIANNTVMTEDYAALERKHGVGESNGFGSDLRKAVEAERKAKQPTIAKTIFENVKQKTPDFTSTDPTREQLPNIKSEAVLSNELGGTSHEAIGAMSDAELNKVFDARKEGGAVSFSPHTDGVAYGLKHPESLKELEHLRDAATKALYDAAESGDNAAYKANFGRSTWAAGAIEGAIKKGPNYDLFKQTQKVEPEVEGVTALDQASGSPLSATDSLINKLEGLKFAEANYGRLYSLPHPEAIAQVGKTAWNNGIDIAIGAVKAGKQVKEAIDEAISYIKKNAKGFDETKIRANLQHLLEKESSSNKADSKTTAKGASTTSTNKASQASLDDVYKIFEPEKKQGSSIKEKAVNTIEAVRTGVSSKFRPLNKLSEDVAKAYGLTKPKDIAGIMEQLKGSRGRGEADIYRFDRDVSDLVKGQEKDFNAYMFLRRSLDRLAQDAATGEGRRKVGNFTSDSLQAKLDALESKLGPEGTASFQKAADAYQAHMDQALRLQVESGRMSPEVYQAIKEGNQFYAPFKVMKYLEETSRPEGTGAKIDTLADFTKAMKGIEDPNFKLGDMLAAGRQSLLISRILSDKNLAMRNVAELAAFDTEGRFIKKLGDNETPPKGMGVVNVLENGKAQKYATNPDVAEALQIYQGQGHDIVTRMLSYASIPFKLGATAINIPFQISNLLADVPRQALISKYGVKGLSDLIRYPLGIVHSLYSGIASDVFGHTNKLMQDYLDSGAAGVTVQEHLTPEALKFQEPTAISKSKYLAKTVLNTLPRFAAAIEQTSKILGVQRAMKIEGVESGAQLTKQIPEAITEIRRFSGSPDFGRQGKWIEQARLNLIYMFLNARIQGAVADVGRLTGRDGAATAAKTWFKIGTAVGIPTAYLYVINNRPEYKEDYEKRPKQEKQNYWLIPKDTYITNDDGEKMRDYWRIPKRESSKWIANMIESALNFAERKDSKSVKDWAQNMIEDISPLNIQGNTTQERLESVGASLNPLIKAPLEVATGRDMYRHKDLIPDSQKKASPELQYVDKTPEVFKKLAEKMPDVAPEFLRSPIILDNLTRNLTAGLITQFLPRKPVEGRSGMENNPLLQRFQALPYTDQEQFRNQIQELERESADETLTRYRAVDKLLEANKGKPLDQIAAKAPMDEKFIRHLADVWVAKQNGATSKDRQLLALPAKQRAAYIADQLQGLAPDKKNQAILDFARKRVLTEGVAAEMVNQDTFKGGIDQNRPKIQNPDGTFSTERTITIESDGKFILIPTIVNGKQLSEQDAIKQWKAGNNKAVGKFDTNEEAEKYAVARSKEIGKLRENGR